MGSTLDFYQQRIEKGSHSFAAAARLLPRELRASTQMLYAWCRHCDDEIDGQILGLDRDANPQRSSAARLEVLREKTLGSLAGNATEPIFLGLQNVVIDHRIPARHPMALIDGMTMDVNGHRFREIEDTLGYAYHVAGVVGVMMAIIMGVRDRSTLERASDLGIAFQLTNIVRDIVPDALVGRVYLPMHWLDEYGISPTDIAQRQNREVVSIAAARMLAIADVYYSSAVAGIAQLPLRSAWAIAAARRVYQHMGKNVKRRGAAAWDGRVATSQFSKITDIAIASAEAVALVSTRRLATFPAREGLWTPNDVSAF